MIRAAERSVGAAWTDCVARRASRWGVGAIVAVLATSAACTRPTRQFELRQLTLSCQEGNTLAHETLTAMGYVVGEIDPAAPAHPGTLRAVRAPDAPRGVAQRVVVRIECRPDGVDVDAVGDGALAGEVEVKRAFYVAFNSVRSMNAGQRDLAAAMVAGTAPESLQRKDVEVVMVPLRGQTAKLDFHFDLVAGGVLPVRVEIRNFTGRRYRLDPATVRLTRADRERVPPLLIDDAAGRIASAPARGPGAEALGRDAVAVRLREQQLTAAMLAPRAEVRGFLYFPAGEYVRGRLVLTEEESAETEGFVVEF